MRVLSFAAVAVLCFGLACGDEDISDDSLIDGIDAMPGQIDSSPDTPDGTPGQIDSSPDTPDAETGDRAQAFCDRYDSLCGYDGGDPNRFDDEAACLSAFDGFDAGQRDCVEGELDDFEVDGMTQHCTRATGAGPCG